MSTDTPPTAADLDCEAAQQVLEEMTLKFCNDRMDVVMSPREWARDFQCWFDEWKFERETASSAAFRAEIRGREQ
jgi:hypothetical protein